MKITASKLIKTVKDLAAKHPETVYKPLADARCFYGNGKATNGEIGCIFGQAFRQLGMRLEELKQIDSNLFLDSGIDSVCRYLGIKATVRQALWMKKVQVEQDACIPWEWAVANAS